MTGLDLESFLLLLRADLGAWTLLGLGTLVLGLLAWLSWGSRQALRKCLALSLIAHAGLALYGSTVPSVLRVLRPDLRDRALDRHIRRIRVSPVLLDEALKPPGAGRADKSGTKDDSDSTAGARPSLDIAAQPAQLANLVQRPPRADAARQGELPLAPAASPVANAPLPRVEATPVVALPRPAMPVLNRRNDSSTPASSPLPAVAIARPSATELAQAVPDVQKRREAAPRAGSSAAATRATSLPPADLRLGTSRERLVMSVAPPPAASAPAAALPVERALPGERRQVQADAQPLADLTGSTSGSRLTEVPSFYRARLDANRSSLARRAGASTASEQAVERALDWLARHQDADGRWDGGTARYDDGTAAAGDDDFTVHCPAGQTCFGECAYWEADTALSALALLGFLGAGYTHKDGKYATTVENGLDFLRAQQKPDGDLRGPSRAVGMYCHAMATLALCEAYALSLDDRLRDPAERAVAFLVRARARDGQAWRYAPNAPVGDTSILGWVVMALKSARETGLRMNNYSSVQNGTLLWLDKVSTGKDRGLARYQPSEPVTATMTAEAWVCRQFLGTGGPGPASTEAAAYLLDHDSVRGESNFYYWYYGTLALYQHGGQPWTQWNDRLRDRIIRLQRATGHQAGSWDPDDSQYGAKGGRIYCTALATLSLEVYYRYLRLYDKPNLPTESKPAVAAEPAPALEAPAPRGS
jgi:hypothetical protein